MTTSEQYRNIFNNEILLKGKSVIFAYNPLKQKYTYQPFSHDVSENAVEELGKLMKHNLFFYAFGEDEVINYYQNGTFTDMEKAAQYAYKQRLPERNSKQDGLPGEVLLDLLVQLYSPDAHKLVTRTIFRQNDNKEIKGYDLTYFVKDNNEISIWLGQAKLGARSYCKGGINDDLISKFVPIYLSKQLFFVCDKPDHLTEDAKEILKAIEKINIIEIESNDSERADKLLQYFKENRIQIKIPCLLAYDKENVYYDKMTLSKKVMDEVQSIQQYFCARSYKFDGFSPEIVFYIFPIQSIQRLRNEATGFYAGLR